jgi:hypothetical protein
VQDSCVLHSDLGIAVEIGAGETIGHDAVIRGTGIRTRLRELPGREDRECIASKLLEWSFRNIAANRELQIPQFQQRDERNLNADRSLTLLQHESPEPFVSH